MNWTPNNIFSYRWASNLVDRTGRKIELGTDWRGRWEIRYLEDGAWRMVDIFNDVLAACAWLNGSGVEVAA